MDQDRFDQLARALGGVKSRRAAVRVAIGSLLGGVGIGAGAADIEAKKKRKKELGAEDGGDGKATARRQSGSGRAAAQGRKKGKGKKNRGRGDGNPVGSSVPPGGCPGTGQDTCHCAPGNTGNCQLTGNGGGHDKDPVDCCCGDPACSCNGPASTCCKTLGTTCGNSSQCCSGVCVSIDATTEIGHCCAQGQVWDPIRDICCTAISPCTGSNCGSISNQGSCNLPQTCTCTNSTYECIEDICTPPVTCKDSCSGGCCAGETCVSSPTDAQCGSNGNACTACSAPTPYCVNGTCVACRAATDCPVPTNECQDRVCTSGTCGTVAKSNGSACDDGNLCTQTDTCQNGACVGSNPVVCTPLDQCHDAGTCNPSTGQCSTPVKPDGSACNDGNACTLTDTCQAGVCTGSNPVQCEPLDECHVAGTCNPSNGQCSNPAGPGGNACVVDEDAGCCVSGVCNTDIVSCGAASPQCCATGAICFNNQCCTPAGQQAACAGKCGRVVDSCGVGYDCGECPILTCKVGTCGTTSSTCSYVDAAQETPCLEDGICCNGICCEAGDVCAVDGGACCTPAGQTAACAGKCGTVVDSCGESYTCGECPILTCQVGTCGATTNTCSYVDAAQETPCDEASICCNGVCCDPGAVCAVDGGACCTPLTVCPGGQNCGTAPDGCGGTIECGVCTPPETCGGGGTAGVCGCTPLTCASFPTVCGFIGLGCGITAFCDLGCPSCTPDCTDKTCGDDGCGGSCGTCPDGSECIEGICSALQICIEEPQTCDPASGLPCCGADGQGVGTCSFGHCCADPEDVYDTLTGTCGTCVAEGGNCLATECCGELTCLGGICTNVAPAPGPCAHAGDRPGDGERCCDRLHLEGGICVINRWDHCDPRNRGKSSFCERGTRCIGGRLSPHGTPVCVPKKKRRGRGGESLAADMDLGYTPAE